MKKIFVYGTLKRGRALHGHMGNALFVDKAYTVMPMVLKNTGWYPVALKSNDTPRPIAGELYFVPDKQLDYLDEVEGPDYNREMVYVKTEGGTVEHCVMYIGKPEVWGPLTLVDHSLNADGRYEF